jgi:hypothetical protein
MSRIENDHRLSLEAQNYTARRSNGADFSEIYVSVISESKPAQQKDGIYHSRTIAGKDYTLSVTPDYSMWDKEDAYCDIIKRYNLLNMLSKEKAAELGLEQAYRQMTDEINNVLYGGDPMTICRNIDEIKALDSDIQQRLNRKVYCEMYGITSDEEYETLFKQDIMSMYDADNFNAGKNGIVSDDIQIYQILSRFDLTEQKTSLINTISGRAAMAGIRFSGVSGGINVYEYLRYNDVLANLDFDRRLMTASAYEHYKEWNDLIRELYDIAASPA